jgi:HD-GYP domain-containing protein (c-di-GMP phosphodiesterase class II)
MAETDDARAGDEGSGGYRRLIDLGIALSAELNHNKLMEMILISAKEMANTDGGTLYLATDEDGLRFQIILNDSLDIAMGGTTGIPIEFGDVPLHDPRTGEANHANVCAHAALTGQSINIVDAYQSTDFDFSGTKKFDEGTKYRSKSFLTVPLKDHEGDVIGVLQLLNAQDPDSGEVIPFAGAMQPLIEALASQAAVSLNNEMLIEAQRKLLDSFIVLIAGAIDAKSHYTGGHCERVPELTQLLALAACDSDDARFRDFKLSGEELYELRTAAWLHDCGKVTTPEYVVDKATKLETIYDRIHEVRARFEILKRDATIENLEARLAGGDETELQARLDARLAQIDDDFAFVAECNVGGEFMAEEKVERLKQIADLEWTRTLDDRIGISFEEARRKERKPAQKLPVREKLLADRTDHVIEREAQDLMPADNKWGFQVVVPEHKFNLGEIYNLSIGRGTLSEEDRYKINEHMIQTIIMLEALPFPKHLKRVPEFAGGHHEKMDGTGYPKRLTKDDMSIPARIMAIADIFEALTAADRPYKPPKTLSESIRIMSFMKKDAHIDADLFELFLQSGVYKEYAEKFLKPEQIDEVDVAQYLGGS